MEIVDVEERTAVVYRRDPIPCQSTHIGLLWDLLNATPNR